MKNDPLIPIPPTAADLRRNCLGRSESWSLIDNQPPAWANEVRRERSAEICRAIPIDEYYPEEGREARALSATDRLMAMKPQDAVESMLALQMVATHENIMTCFHKASVVSDPRMAASLLEQARRMELLQLKQIESWDRHRRRGEQKVRVEHVYINSVEQASFGTVNTSPLSHNHVVEGNSRPATSDRCQRRGSRSRP